MAQVFPAGANTLAKASILGAVALPLALIAMGMNITRSGYNTNVDVPLEQPVPFSHQHHANELGIDCRYCHTTVEKSAFAGIPPTHTCMSCHSQIWTNSPLLEPVRQSYKSQTPIKKDDGTLGWTRVNKLPEFVYFNHSIHINRGVNCNVCHGPIQKMQITYKGKPFFMSWCLDCHRNPEGYIGKKSDVFDLYVNGQRGHALEADGKTTRALTSDERNLLEEPGYKPSAARIEEGKKYIQEYKIRKEQLTDCWVCHR